MKHSRKKHILISLAAIALVVVGVWFISRDDSPAQGAPAKTNIGISQTETPDQIRVRNINNINVSLSNALKRGIDLPLPENALKVKYGEETLSYQGRMPAGLYPAIGLVHLVDPKTNEPYFYALSADKTTYAIMALLNTRELGNSYYFTLATMMGRPL